MVLNECNDADFYDVYDDALECPCLRHVRRRAYVEIGIGILIIELVKFAARCRRSRR